MRASATWLILVVLVVAPLSGCIQVEDGTAASTESEAEASLEPELYSIHCEMYDDLERCWKLLVPESVNGDEPVPLVVDIHGFTQDMDKHSNTTTFADIAIEEGFIVAYPNGYENSWNAGTLCCGVAHQENIDDVSFILGMIEHLIATQPVDADRIYLSGWSNGCAMTQMLTVQASEVFAAAGCMSFYLIAEASPTYSPVPFMEVHGFLDDLIVYGNAAMLYVFSEDEEWAKEGALQNLEDWKKLNNCTGLAPELCTVELDYDIRGYTDCENGAEVRLMTLNYAGHNPYAKDAPDYQLGSPEDLVWSGRKNPTGIESTRIVWDFLKEFSQSDEPSMA